MRSLFFLFYQILENYLLNMLPCLFVMGIGERKKGVMYDIN